MVQVFSNVMVGLYFMFGVYQGIEIVCEQMSNIIFIVVVK